ncbi:MAG TPA: outer membrane beta-barrel protein [Roseiarcus sp.]|nr:outer membrane beta-barrel protein [Roseiarcus sp.]
MKVSLGVLSATLLFGATTASAADLDTSPYTPAPPVGAPRWEGAHIGLNAGAFMSPSSVSTMTWFPPGLITTGIPGSFSMTQMGGMAGAQAGFAKQWGGFVLGAEADYDFATGAAGSKSLSGTYFGSNFTVTQKQALQSLGTVRANVGFAPVDDLLIYATGGLAFGRTHLSSDVQFDTGLAFAGSSNSTAVGFALGGGVEYAFDPNWSIGAQFLYYDLGRSFAVGAANQIFPPSEISPETDTTADFKGYTLRLTLNYEFGNNTATSPAAYGQLPSDSDFAVTLGVRAGMSTGSSKLNLYDGTGSVLLSRLTYHDAPAATGEIYGRIDERDGLFGKAYVGVGRLSSGTLQDEDFPPGIVPYSSTNSSQQYGELNYATVDVGYYAYQTNWYKVGGLAGWNFLNEDFNAFGCTQTATNPGVCAPGEVAQNNLGISDNNSWNSPRLGLVGEATLANGFTARAEAAWLPVMFFHGDNTHYLRIPQDFSGPVPEDATGYNGYQVEAEVDYTISPALTVGFGARYWSLNAKGHVEFQNAVIGGGPQVATFETQRLQAFAQTAYHF